MVMALLDGGFFFLVRRFPRWASLTRAFLSSESVIAA
jgi:hypothetical protein